MVYKPLDPWNVSSHWKAKGPIGPSDPKLHLAQVHEATELWDSLLTSPLKTIDSSPDFCANCISLVQSQGV